MRRRDFIIIILLAGVALASWHKLRPPLFEEGEASNSSQVLDLFTRWSGPIERAQARSSSSSSEAGEVKGASTDTLASGSATVTPVSLLPVEEYIGSPALNTLEAMLLSHNVTINPEDIVEAFPSPQLGLGSVIKVYRATPIEVTDWGKKKTYRTWKTSVSDFLEEQKVELGDNDRVEPTGSTSLTLNADGTLSSIVITRVAITEVKEKEKIDFKVIEKEDPNLPRGQTKVDKGEKGERVKTFRVTRENGVEIKRELIKNEVTKQPKDEARVIGTKVIIGKTYTGRASWYKYNSTKVATDLFRRGTNLRITNLDNGKVIFVKNDGCICADTGYVVDLHPDHFTSLGGKLTDGVMKRIKVDEVLN